MEKDDKVPCVAITGASGYVGRALTHYFHIHGWKVLKLCRCKNKDDTNQIFFELNAELPSLNWQEIDALVHCAHDFRPRTWSAIERTNVHGGFQLLRAAAAGGVKGVFISSLSSFEGCRSLYGKAKFALEQKAVQLGFSVVRPGLVWGEENGSMMAALERTVQMSALIPLIGNGSFPQYLIHHDDLAHVVFKLCQPHQVPLTQPLSIAAAEKISLRILLIHLAERHGRKPIFLPIPWRLLLLSLRIMETIQLSVPFRSDSLLGIVHQNSAPDFSSSQQLGFSFRSFL